MHDSECDVDRDKAINTRFVGRAGLLPNMTKHLLAILICHAFNINADDTHLQTADIKAASRLLRHQNIKWRQRPPFHLSNLSTGGAQNAHGTYSHSSRGMRWSRKSPGVSKAFCAMI